MRIARKYSSEIVKEALIEALSDGTYDNTAKLMLEEYAEQLATDFADYLLTGYIVVAPYFQRCWKSGKDAKTYSTNQLYEQFMIERSRRTQKE